MSINPTAQLEAIKRDIEFKIEHTATSNERYHRIMRDRLATVEEEIERVKSVQQNGCGCGC